MGKSVLRKGSYGEYRKVHYVGVPTATYDKMVAVCNEMVVTRDKICSCI